MHKLSELKFSTKFLRKAPDKKEIYGETAYSKSKTKKK